MFRFGSRARRLATAAAFTSLGLAVGATIGVPRDGAAAGQTAPVNSGTPTISGTPQEGHTLTGQQGTWTGDPGSYAYAWSRCDQNGNGCSAISGASGQTYQLVKADVGGTIRFTVTASNADGATSAVSAPTAVVSAGAAPTSTAPPTISGTVQVGSTLTATSGSWNGASSFAYAWSRCDQNGNSCAQISGATGTAYQLKQVDAGATLRVSVTASNGAGSTTSTSVPTAVVPGVPTPAPTGCPSGGGTLPVDQVAAPARLVIDQQSVIPGLVTPGVQTLRVQARVTACGGRPVEGALLYATAVPYNQYSVPPEAKTNANGVAELTMSQLSGFPAARRQQLLVMFLRARKPSDPITGGISTRLLVSFPVSLR